jgi:multidrug efflux pump subunit AcrA (membrane-fusion protein)
MKKKVIAIGISLLIVLMALLVVKALPSGDKESVVSREIKSALVEVIYPTTGDVTYQLLSTGKIVATERFEIFAQAEGQLLPMALKFKEGQKYRKGETLLAIDAEEFRMTLMAQKSEFITSVTSVLPDLKSDYPNNYVVWREYAVSLNIKQALPVLPTVNDEQLKFFLAGKGIYTRYYQIQSLQEKLAKYIIKAPFDGVVISSRVEAGKAVRPGTELGVFINPAQYELEVTLPLHAVNRLEISATAELTSSEISGNWQGKVVRIGGNIDEQSQNIKVFISTQGKGLKEGMFLTAEIESLPFENALSIPRKMVSSTNEVFIVEDDTLRLVKVNVLSKQGDEAIVEGLPENTGILSTVIKNAYNGMPVRIKN